MKLVGTNFEGQPKATIKTRSGHSFRQKVDKAMQKWWLERSSPRHVWSPARSLRAWQLWISCVEPTQVSWRLMARGRQEGEGCHSSCLPFYRTGMGTKSKNFPKWRISGAMHLCTYFTKVTIKTRTIQNHQKATGFTWVLEIVVALCYLSVRYYVITRWWEVSRRNKNQLGLFWMSFCLLACRLAAS